MVEAEEMQGTVWNGTWAPWPWSRDAPWTQLSLVPHHTLPATIPTSSLHRSLSTTNQTIPTSSLHRSLSTTDQMIPSSSLHRSLSTTDQMIPTSSLHHSLSTTDQMIPTSSPHRSLSTTNPMIASTSPMIPIIRQRAAWNVLEPVSVTDEWPLVVATCGWKAHWKARQWT
jgi:hypothetical protein